MSRPSLLIESTDSMMHPNTNESYPPKLNFDEISPQNLVSQIFKI